jgi:hypothetical protein
MAVTFGFLRRSSILASRDAIDSTRVRALEVRVATLEARLRGLHLGGERINAGVAHVVLPASPEQAKEAGEEPPAPTRTERAQTPKAPIDEVALEREYFGELDARLAGETRDPVWAAATEERLRVSAPDVQPRMTVGGVQCAQTMCRLDASAVNPKDDLAALEKFLMITGGLLPEAVIRDGEAPGHHVIYFARPGEAFPPMNPPEMAAQ